jgi:S-DNA-T family DNA segregation ATPase FtsK/SpoIIIE
MVKYDGPAFFRKKGVNFNNPSLSSKEAQSSMMKNEDFTPAIKQRKQVPETDFPQKVEEQSIEPVQSTSTKVSEPVRTEPISAPIEKTKNKTPRFKMPRTSYKAPKRPEQVINKIQNRHQLEKSHIELGESTEPFVEQSLRQEVTPKPVASVSEPVKTQVVEQQEQSTFTRSENNALGYQFPDLNLLPSPVIDTGNTDEWVEDQIQRLNDALLAFDVDADVVNWTVGPTVTQFEVELGRGVKVNKITNLTDDLKLQLAAKDIRIEAPIPGKNTVGIEVPNLNPRPVPLSEIISSDAFKSSASPLTIALGVDLFGQPQTYDLRKMPHGLIAGATGSGKSVFINSVLVSLLYKATPQELKLLLIDPKTVELAPYNELPHLLAPVISDPKAASASLKWVTKEMDERYERLAAAGARNIEQFNKKAEKAGDFANKMPYIVVIIDELADLMMVSSSEVQDYIVRITQKARAAGIHLLIATQRPSVDVVTGLIKNNIPTRVAFMVSSQVDSRTILDHSGAERLLGRGDMLFLGNGKSNPSRLQGAFIDEEIDDVTDFVREQAAPHYAFNPTELKAQSEELNSEDELMDDVLEFLGNEETISTSKLQRMFSIGYNRAATIIDQLEASGYISGSRGSKPREVFYDGSSNEE